MPEANEMVPKGLCQHEEKQEGETQVTSQASSKGTENGGYSSKDAKCNDLQKVLQRGTSHVHKIN